MCVGTVAAVGRCVKCFLRGTPPPCRYVEVVATVQDDLTIKQDEHDQTIPLGDNLGGCRLAFFFVGVCFRRAVDTRPSTMNCDHCALPRPSCFAPLQGLDMRREMVSPLITTTLFCVVCGAYRH